MLKIKETSIATRKLLTDLKRYSAMKDSLPSGFVSDLEKAYDAEVLGPNAMQRLDATLRSWYKRCAKHLASELKKLPPLHPIKCPISVLDTRGFSRLEVAHTRTLAWLLDPTKEHGFSDALIRGLVCELGTAGIPPRLHGVKVKAERFFRDSDTEGVGRTDVWVEAVRNDRPWLLVIEAKIDAQEGSDQLASYNKAIADWERTHVDCQETTRVFLTPDGREPSSGSPEWKPLSFKSMARAFCRTLSSLRGREGYHFLRFYLSGVFRDILDLPTGTNAGDHNRYKLLAYLIDADRPPAVKENHKMSATGSALGFYIRHWQVMQALNDDGRSLLATMPVDMQEKLKEVKKRAEKQTDDLLKRCAEAIDTHCKHVANARSKVRSRQPGVAQGIKLRLWPKRCWHNGPLRREIGVWIEEYKHQPVLVLYIWARGGSPAEERLACILGAKVTHRSEDFGWRAGSVFVGQPIPLKAKKDFTLDEGELLLQLKQRLKLVKKHDLQRILS
jgi:hypothetical protein